MRNPLSSKVTELQPSGIRKFFDIVTEMKDAIYKTYYKKKGQAVVDMNNASIDHGLNDLVEVAIPNLKVGQRDGKVVHHLRLEEVLLAVADELVETAMSLGSATEFEEGQSLIENLLGLGIVVVHGCRRLGGSVGGQLPILAGLHIVAQQLIGTAQEVVEIVVLRSLQLALAKVVGVEEALLEQANCLFKQ